MTIEIHSPHLKIKETALEAIQKKIVALSHFGKHISRAEIFLTEEPPNIKKNKICRIRLDIIGNTLYLHKKADSFEKAAGDAIKVLGKLLKQKNGHRTEPADKILSTVGV